jgi:hypothetical protein
MKYVDQGQALRLFYKTDQLTTGQSVTFNIWNDSGTKLYDEAASEISTEGVYYYDLTAPSSDLYLLVIGANNGTDPEAQVIKVGNPAEKAFYVHGTFRTEQTIAYEIYNASATILSSGNLTEVVAGFYVVDVDGLSEPWFLQIPPWTAKNTTDLKAQ